jgi:hypothetical protein
MLKRDRNLGKLFSVLEMVESEKLFDSGNKTRFGNPKMSSKLLVLARTEYLTSRSSSASKTGLGTALPSIMGH